MQAGASDDGKELAAQYAEAIFSPHLTIEAAKPYYDDVKARMRKIRPRSRPSQDSAGPQRDRGARPRPRRAPTTSSFSS